MTYSASDDEKCPRDNGILNQPLSQTFKQNACNVMSNVHVVFQKFIIPFPGIFLNTYLPHIKKRFFIRYNMFHVIYLLVIGWIYFSELFNDTLNG